MSAQKIEIEEVQKYHVRYHIQISYAKKKRKKIPLTFKTAKNFFVKNAALRLTLAYECLFVNIVVFDAINNSLEFELYLMKLSIEFT